MQALGNTFLSLGALLGGLGVAAGAFGAHGLKAILTEQQLAWWQTGAQYQMIHALLLAVLGVVAWAFEREGQLLRGAKMIRVAGWLTLAGILIFSGSLYVMALTDLRILGAITPLGGTCFIGAWLLLTVAAARRA